MSHFSEAPAPLRVLIVEDDADLASLVERLLAARATVTVVADGIGAVSAFRTALSEGRPFHTVCLDLNLPGMDGLRVLRAMRRAESEPWSGTHAKARIVMMTVHGGRDPVLQAAAGGVDGYLVKPFAPDDLLRRLVGESVAATP